jgi:hypothetical protein
LTAADICLRSVSLLTRSSVAARMSSSRLFCKIFFHSSFLNRRRGISILKVYLITGLLEPDRLINGPDLNWPSKKFIFWLVSNYFTFLTNKIETIQNEINLSTNRPKEKNHSKI